VISLTLSFPKMYNKCFDQNNERFYKMPSTILFGVGLCCNFAKILKNPVHKISDIRVLDLQEFVGILLKTVFLKKIMYLFTE